MSRSKSGGPSARAAPAVERIAARASIEAQGPDRTAEDGFPSSLGYVMGGLAGDWVIRESLTSHGAHHRASRILCQGARRAFGATGRGEMNEPAMRQAQFNHESRDQWDGFATHRAKVSALLGAGGPRGATRLCVLGAGNCN